MNNYSGYVWANISNLSTFAIVGSALPVSSPVSISVSGGGGGVASGEPFENIAKREVQEEYLRIGVPATYTFTTPELPVYEVSITPAKNFAEGDISMLRWMEFGVNVARRGWLEKKDLMNSRSCRDVRFKS
jgi:hypothetical protein